ncbi:hypothetical protein K3495_g10020 [Podosphaera aphanis]|nr:hypothetical protein K3495_g10020 [Podosphaera aphanis]
MSKPARDPDPESTREAKAVNPNSSELQIITRSGKIAGRDTERNDNKGFGSTVPMKVKALNALHMEHSHEPTSSDVSSIPFESLTIEQAFAENKQAWEASILDELKSLEKNNTYRIIKLNTASNNRKFISSRWVLRNKFNSDGSIARRKARIVGKGYEQQYGIDYFKTFATVVRYTTLRAVLSYAAVHDFELIRTFCVLWMIMLMRLSLERTKDTEKLRRLDTIIE